MTNIFLNVYKYDGEAGYQNQSVGKIYKIQKDI